MDDLQLAKEECHYGYLNTNNNFRDQSHEFVLTLELRLPFQFHAEVFHQGCRCRFHFQCALYFRALQLNLNVAR